MAQKVKATIVRRLRWLLFSSEAASIVVVDVSSWVCFCDDVFSDRGEASFFRESEFEDDNASSLLWCASSSSLLSRRVLLLGCGNSGSCIAEDCSC